MKAKAQTASANSLNLRTKGRPRSGDAGVRRSKQPVAYQERSNGTSRLGVLYVSFGEEYKALTTLSIACLRRSGYSGPVRIITDSDDWTLDGLDTEPVIVPFRGLGFATRYYKTQINKYGFDITLFLDADTVPIATIRPIWHELRFADICLPLDSHRHVEGCKSNPREYRYMNNLGLMQHPFYSSGVILFRRSSASDKLFATWHEEWNRFRCRDQLALVRAVARTRSNVHILVHRWNGALRSFGSLEKAVDAGVRILHLRPGLTFRPAIRRSP